MANDYCTLADVKQTIMDVDPDLTYDAFFEALIPRASRLVDGLLKREAGAFYVSADTTRYFTGSGDGELWIGELAAAPTSVSVAETGSSTYTLWAATDYLCWPYNALLEGKPFLRLDIDAINGSQSYWYRYPRCVKVVGKFGFSTAIPEEVKEATVIQVVRWWKRAQQAYQDTGAVVELGQLRYVRELDPDVKLLLSEARFQRMTV